MDFPRSCGILLHPTSLPGPYGIGDIGNTAHRFIDFLYDSGQTYWQILPLGPTGYGDSPYQTFCAFAGNPLLISPDELVRDGLLDVSDITSHPDFSDTRVQYGEVIQYKFSLLEKAHERFSQSPRPELRSEFDEWCGANQEWLDDFATYMALKHHHDGRVWTQWDPPLRDRREDALHEWTRSHAPDVEKQKVWQWLFARQWDALRAYAREKDIRFIGDIPIYVAHDSSDVWSNREMFLLDDQGNPTVVAGVPPDYFSDTGQLWGNPLYNWKYLQDRGYDWWMKRFQQCLTQVDIVRLDHFRGFESYWEVPASEETAMNGQWVKGPSEMIFDTLKFVLGDLPIIAENLGVITDEVEELRHRFDLPGMAVLQFGFGSDADNTHLPHNHEANQVVYTATHDNDTIMGWWNETEAGDSTRTLDDIEREKDFARNYMGYQSGPFNWEAIRILLMSVAHTAIIPMQDVLGLGHESRMNRPAQGEGNWQWRMQQQSLDEPARQLKAMCALYGREKKHSADSTNH